MRVKIKSENKKMKKIKIKKNRIYHKYYDFPIDIFKRKIRLRLVCKFNFLIFFNQSLLLRYLLFLIEYGSF
jgi:hypothetical protein